MRGLVLPISSSILTRVVSASVCLLCILIACVSSAGVRAQGGLDSSNRESLQPKKKGLAPVRQEEAPDGSRVTVTYNAPLSDYSAYRRGDRFVVVIPKADAPRVRSNLRGRGFDGVQVERRGEDTVLSFRIQPGTKARVDQQHNRLDVVFTAPEQTTANAASGSGQTTAVPQQSSTAKAWPTNQARAAAQQTPLANHNATANATTEADAVKPGGEVRVAADSTTAQTGSTATTPPQSTTPSTGSPAAPAPLRADETAAAGPPAPSLSPTASSSSLGTGATRYWLPLAIAMLLLTSAWAVIASRRRAAERSSRSITVEPASTQQIAEAEAETEAHAETKTEPETTAPLPESAEELALPVEAREEVIAESPALPSADNSGIPSRILNYLGSEDANERSAGVLGLADFLSDEAFGRIGAAFDDPSQQVRDAAARSLFNVSADRAASFKRLMRDASPERRRRVGEAIASSGMAGEAISDLSSESGERAYDALLVLSLMAKSGEVRSLIETIEEHPSTEVRLAIVKLLALSGRQEILHAFRYLSTRDSLPVAVRSSIMEAIYQLNNPQAFPLSTT
jgi:hypothetical protein